MAGTVTVKVNFGEDGHVIVAQNTPRIVVDGVPPDVMEEALRIVKTSGSIIQQLWTHTNLNNPCRYGTIKRHITYYVCKIYLFTYLCINYFTLQY